MNMIENELSIVLEEIVSNNKKECDESKPDMIKMFSKRPSYTIISQLHMVQTSIDLLRNELDQMRDSSYQRPNFALESNGAEIVSVFDTKMEVRDFFSCLLKSIFKYGCDLSKSPRNLIKGKPEPGECWMFKSFPGKVLIKLSAPTFIDAIAIQHIWEKESINGVSDAPKEFKVYASNNDAGDKRSSVILGHFTYDVHTNRSIQVFNLKKKTLLSYLYVYFEFLSNHGHPSHTCVYRIRVHGTIDSHKFGKINET